MIRRVVSILACLALAPSARAADLWWTEPAGRFVATCEDLPGLCFAQACGRDQIDAELGCRARCPSAVTMSVVPATCPIAGRGAPVLRRRG
ncbi:hypothetical protein Q8W71_02325 [Methylobacterium sp. NEAU 140]|uniref:hypothetical protein n=1 Tax=Methylobacterium sp. NEAU 140 TaxID=3064945 RepID=UPI0027355EFC|nr:hypothetical protein [Methylobacterium sp. NEAU 140]MDP4021445.1 hypothetical protein [Methylobacterium sp. NEAU 140]